MNADSIDVSFKNIRINDVTVALPYPIRKHLLNGERLYLILYTDQKRPCDNPDFRVPSDERNLIAFDNQAQIDWIIDAIPGIEQGGYHQDFLDYQGRYLTKHTDGIVRFDPETGDVVEFLPENELPIGDTRITVSGEIYRVLEFQDTIFVECAGEHNLYAFETDGTERWRSDAGTKRGNLSAEDGQLWEQIAADRTTDYRYRVDPDTGERLSKEEIDTGLW